MLNDGNLVLKPFKLKCLSRPYIAPFSSERGVYVYIFLYFVYSLTLWLNFFFKRIFRFSDIKNVTSSLMAALWPHFYEEIEKNGVKNMEVIEKLLQQFQWKTFKVQLKQSLKFILTFPHLTWKSMGKKCAFNHLWAIYKWHLLTHNKLLSHV